MSLNYQYACIPTFSLLFLFFLLITLVRKLVSFFFLLHEPKEVGRVHTLGKEFRLATIRFHFTLADREPFLMMTSYEVI